METDILIVRITRTIYRLDTEPPTYSSIPAHGSGTVTTARQPDTELPPQRKSIAKKLKDCCNVKCCCLVTCCLLLLGTTTLSMACSWAYYCMKSNAATGFDFASAILITIAFCGSIFGTCGFCIENRRWGWISDRCHAIMNCGACACCLFLITITIILPSFGILQVFKGLALETKLRSHI